MHMLAPAATRVFTRMLLSLAWLAVVLCALEQVPVPVPFANCGVLTPVAPWHCPTTDAGLVPCSDIEVKHGQLCRGDGACGTRSSLANCATVGVDVYLKAVHAHNTVCDWQGYLDRYAHLKAAFGPTNTAGAQDHYYRAGQREGLDCTSEASHAHAVQLAANLTRVTTAPTRPPKPKRFPALTTRGRGVRFDKPAIFRIKLIPKTGSTFAQKLLSQILPIKKYRVTHDGACVRACSHVCRVKLMNCQAQRPCV